MTTPGLGGKSKQELVREANQRRQEKINTAKEREEVRQEKFRVEREKKMARDKEKAERQQKADKEREEHKEKLRKARERAKKNQTIDTKKMMMTTTPPTCETEQLVKKFKMNKSYKSKLASSHRDETSNEWDPTNMKAAVEGYHAQQLPDWPVLTPKLSIR